MTKWQNELHVKMFTPETRQTDSKAGFPANAMHATHAKNLRIYEVTQGNEHNEMTSLSIGQSQPPATTAYAAGTLPICGTHGRNYWN